jgi:hypothetical protein
VRIRQGRSWAIGFRAALTDLSPGEHLPDDRLSVVAVFEFAADRHDVAGALDHPRPRQIGASGVVEEHQTAPGRERSQPWRNPVWISCIGPLIAGTLIVSLGGYRSAAPLIGLFFILGVIAAPFLPETKGKPLPHALWLETPAVSTRSAP